MPETYLHFQFRWPVEQIGQNQIQVTIPNNGEFPVFSPEFIREQRLSPTEMNDAITAALRAIALIH